MSRQLAISATASVLAMAAFALLAPVPGSRQPAFPDQGGQSGPTLAAGPEERRPARGS